MMTKIVFCLCILSVSSFAMEGIQFHLVDSRPATPKQEAKPAEKSHVDIIPVVTPEQDQARASTRPAAKPLDPNAPSAAEERYVPNPLKVVLRIEERLAIRELNQAREAAGLKMLSPAPSLMAGARSHSGDMRDRNYFAHKASNLLPGNGMRGENIAAGNRDPGATMQQWWKSSGHKNNMMSPNFLYIGIGRASGGGKYGEYWTQNFSSAP